MDYSMQLQQKYWQCWCISRIQATIIPHRLLVETGSWSYDHIMISIHKMNASEESFSGTEFSQVKQEELFLSYFFIDC